MADKKRSSMAQDVAKVRLTLHNGKRRSQVLFYVRVIKEELQHYVVIVDIDKKQ